MAPPAAAEAAALADAEALAEAEALADAEEALPLPEEQPARTAAMPAAAPTPMKPLLVKFFIMHSFPFSLWVRRKLVFAAFLACSAATAQPRADFYPL